MLLIPVTFTFAAFTVTCEPSSILIEACSNFASPPKFTVAPATVVVPVPTTPFSNDVSPAVPVINNSPVFSTSALTSLSSKVTFLSDVLPAFFITASPVLFLNVTVETLSVPVCSEELLTVIALLNPSNPVKSLIVNVYVLAFIPSKTPVAGTAFIVLLFPDIHRSYLNDNLLRSKEIL